ncbi:MAG: hypothetical protein J6M24_02115 [Lachnospiraceae bacterium]|nr:hypothetical protein [Lachnospiraceae bacterium]
MISWKTARHIIYGFLAGTAGVKILSGKTAKKAYTHITAAALRGADDVISRAEIIKENCQDIYNDARNINQKIYDEDEEQLIKDAREIIREAEDKTEAEA